VEAEGAVDLNGGGVFGVDRRFLVAYGAAASLEMGGGVTSTSLDATVAIETDLQESDVTVGAFGSLARTSGPVEEGTLSGTRSTTGVSVGGFLVTPLTPGLTFDAYAASGWVGVDLDVANDELRVESAARKLQAQLGMNLTGSVEWSVVTFTPTLGVTLGAVQSGSFPVTVRAFGVREEVDTEVQGATVLRPSFQPRIQIDLAELEVFEALRPLDLTLTPVVHCDVGFDAETTCGWSLDAGVRVPLQNDEDGATLDTTARNGHDEGRHEFGATLRVIYPY